MEQTQQILKTVGVCRHLYNPYLATNQARHQQGLSFLSAYAFDTWVNHEYAQEHPWVKEVSSKARKKVLVNAETAYRRFFKGIAEYPKFKKKHKQSASFYAPKNNPGDWMVERHRIKIPTLGWVRLKEFGYIPAGSHITGGTITQTTDRYFVSVTVQPEPLALAETPKGEGLGVDLGIKAFAVTSMGIVFLNLNKTFTILKLERRLRLAQRAWSRKLHRQKRGEIPAANRRNIDKTRVRIQKLYGRLAHRRSADRAAVIRALVKTKPAFITLEHLNIRGMLKNRHLSKAIQPQGFYAFKGTLVAACRKAGIEVREVAPFYPSSKLCSRCEHKKHHWTLKDRVYTCEPCGLVLDRDWNAAMNLAQATTYQVIS